MQLYMELGLPEKVEDGGHEAVLNIVRAAACVRGVGARILRQFGLTEAQFNVLLLLKHKERELTQTDLGERLEVTRASITSVLDRLEGKGLVRRNRVPDNRRIYHVALRTAGLALLDKVEPVYRDGLTRIVIDLGADERLRLMGSLERVRQKAGEISDEFNGT
jgi:MarR family 2-MHQ and catechol resistance regulon transcriptional repressor